MIDTQQNRSVASEFSNRFSLRFGTRGSNVSTEESVDPKTSHKEVIDWSHNCVDKVKRPSRPVPLTSLFLPVKKIVFSKESMIISPVIIKDSNIK
jgi:hypothetical protein